MKPQNHGPGEQGIVCVRELDNGTWRDQERWGASKKHERSSHTLDVTVVVCTLGRPDSLKRFLLSLAEQSQVAEDLFIVDATPHDGTQRVVEGFENAQRLGGSIHYVRVVPPLRGLTRQRNLALQAVTTKLVVYFDDDVVLDRKCLQRMAETFGHGNDQVVGVAADVTNNTPEMFSRRLRAYKSLRMLPSLEPGRFHRNGMVISSAIHGPFSGVKTTDWLPGCAMMWNSSVAKSELFCELFEDYALAEDLEFSLRAGRHGRLLVRGDAHVKHLHEVAARPGPVKLGYMEIYNRYYVHRYRLDERTWRDVLYFVYSWTIDSIILCKDLVRPGNSHYTALQLVGRLLGAWDCLRGKVGQTA